MDKLADSLVKYNNVNGDSLSTVGKGLKDLGIGLIALLGGSVAGVGASIVNGLSSLFGLDPVSQIQKFEKVDSEKIYKLGLGLKFMGEGLNVHFIELQDQDASELGFQQITKIIENTDLLTFERVMELKMGLIWT